MSIGMLGYSDLHLDAHCDFLWFQHRGTILGMRRVANQGRMLSKMTNLSLMTMTIGVNI